MLLKSYDQNTKKNVGTFEYLQYILFKKLPINIFEKKS